MNACPEGGGGRGAQEARRNGAVVHPRAQSGQGRKWEAGSCAFGAWSGGARGRSMQSVLRAARWVRIVSMSERARCASGTSGAC